MAESPPKRIKTDGTNTCSSTLAPGADVPSTSVVPSSTAYGVNLSSTSAAVPPPAVSTTTAWKTSLFDVAHYALWVGHHDVGRLIGLSRAFYDADEFFDGEFGLSREVYLSSTWGKSRTRLQHAASVGNTLRVRRLLDAGADVHAGNDLALRLALANAHAETAILLVDRGASAAAAVYRDGEPLCASSSCDVSAFRKIVRELASPPLVSYAHSLLIALVNLDADGVAKYVAAGMAELDSTVKDEQERFDSWSTPLNDNVIYGGGATSVATARAFLTHDSFGAEVVLDTAGRLAAEHRADAVAWVKELCAGHLAATHKGLALWAASSAGLVDEAAKLLASGADPMHDEGLGGEEFAIVVAGYAGHRAVVELLAAEENFYPGVNMERAFHSDNLDAEWALIAAASCGAHELVTRLLAGGVDDAVWARGESPLSEAASKGHLSVVRALLAQRGASLAPYYGAIGDRDDPAYVASAWRDLCSAPSNAREIAELLIAHGARPSAAALIGAAESREGTPVLRVLLDAGGDACGTLLCARNSSHKKTPLHAAAITGCLASVELLLDRGADVDAVRVTEGPYSHRNRSGPGGLYLCPLERNTALLLATRWGHSAVVAALLDRGADMHARCGMGHTALHYACACGWRDSQRVLEARGAGF